MKDLKFLGGLVLVVVLIFSLIIGMTAGFSIVFEQNYCKTMQSLHTDFDFRWELWGGCLVKTPSGYWINASDYQYFEGDVR